ncbi:Crp/Fnr family transcriptional regulator [Acinetobacter sp. DSM 11652]|uniref:Crp/Fnr family transcriptional regulator n=1 Tax=Acinetobacter sp. DSM 11652 TaxID=346222 RepID=UPI0008C7F4FF|nr:Crp/Fnr family transcriptional regulator [Acinetobacter sp. DSM 11652]SEL34097.1 cAMP-binding domain of CRP or a regulatory subunit of cAMP-dependent protein kinases [Acinetobacter sp. DSM 11652]
MLLNQYVYLLKNNWWFSQFDHELQQLMLEHAQLIEYGKEQLIFSKADQFDGIYAVIDGAVRLAHIDVEGREAVTVIADPIMWFGEISLIDQQPRSHHAITSKKSKILKISLVGLDLILEQYPKFWFYLAQLVSHKLRYAFMELVSIQTQPLIQRLAQRLIFILNGYGNLKEIEKNTINLSQEQLAQMLVCSRQTINQELQHLEKIGAIKIAFKKIEVINLTQLKALADQT